MSAIQRLLDTPDKLPDVEDTLRDIANKAYLSESQAKKLTRYGWEAAVEAAFDDDVLSVQEEQSLLQLKDHFGLTQSDLDANGAYSRVVKGAILRDLMEGKVPERVTLDGTLPFNFQKSEQLIWVFQDVDYLEEKKRREYVGGSQGVSVRVAKGVYLRAGAFKAKPVDRLETVHAATGMMAVTNKHIYFAGGNKNFRIRFDKIVVFEPFSDGVSIQRDAQTARPQAFRTSDGWFTYNLLQNAARL